MIMERRSSLEIMLEQIQQREEQPEDVPPALPTRPVTKARLPRSRRKLKFTSQRSDFDENGSLDMVLSFEENMFRNKRTKSGDSDRVVFQESAEMTGVGASADEIYEGCDCRNKDGISEKICDSDDGNGLLLEGLLETMRHLQSCQSCCYCDDIKRGVIAFQSFIRGENARKVYIRNMTAIAVIQKHLKGHLRSRISDEEEDESQGWMAWEYFNSIDKKGKQLNKSIRNARNLDNMDSEIKVPYSVLVDLRRQVMKTEALLEKEKEENALLQLKIKQLERRREQYESEMKSMEKMWQDQLTSIQMNIEASKQSSASKNGTGKLGQLLALPEICDQSADDAASPSIRTTEIGSLNQGSHLLDQHDGDLFNSDRIIYEVLSEQNSEEDLQKLKVKFKTWKKDFKTRLIEVKTTMKKLGNSGTRKRQKKWWGKMKRDESENQNVVLCT